MATVKRSRASKRKKRKSAKERQPKQQAKPATQGESSGKIKGPNFPKDFQIGVGGSGIATYATVLSLDRGKSGRGGGGKGSASND